MHDFAWLGLVLGLIFGSFANVVIHRLPLEHSIVRPRSRCPSCGRQLPWWENVPLLSFAVLRGRCSGCGAPISWRYPLVELLFGLWGLGLMLAAGDSLSLAGVSRFVVEFTLGGMLITASFIDLDHFILPDVLTLPGALIALLGSMFVPGLLEVPGPASHMIPDLGLLHPLLGAVLGGGSFWLLQQGYRLLRGVEGLGTGDVKLMLLLGAWLGWWSLPVVVLLASVLGLLAGLAAMRASPGEGLQARIPFGPFLSAAGMFYALVAERFWAWYLG